MPTKKTTKKPASKSDKIDLSNIKGYNVKLRKTEKILDAKITTMKNGRKAVKGVGSDGTGMFRII